MGRLSAAGSVEIDGTAAAVLDSKAVLGAAIHPNIWVGIANGDVGTGVGLGLDPRSWEWILCEGWRVTPDCCLG